MQFLKKWMLDVSLRGHMATKTNMSRDENLYIEVKMFSRICTVLTCNVGFHFKGCLEKYLDLQPLACLFFFS